MASVHHGLVTLNGVCRSPSNGIIIDNRDYMDTIIVMLENPQSLSPTPYVHCLTKDML